MNARVMKTITLYLALAMTGSLISCRSSGPVGNKKPGGSAASSSKSVQGSSLASSTIASSSSPDAAASTVDDVGFSESVSSSTDIDVENMSEPSPYSVKGMPLTFVTSSANYTFRLQPSSATKVYSKTKLDASKGTVIEINPEVANQRIQGFGAAFTESSAYCLCKIPKAERDKVMKRLFDTNGGIGLSYMRTAIGASDFALQNYTYDDMPKGQDDMELAHFSIERDMSQTIPIIKQALGINPQMRILASPWTAPPWMKTYYTYADVAGGVTDSITLRKDCYDVYAQYLVKFLQAYKAQGIPIYGLTAQNEPNCKVTYAGMMWDNSLEAKFITDYLYPKLQKNGLSSTKLFAWDWDWDSYNIALNWLFSNPDAFGGVAFHGYGGDATQQQNIYNAFPDKEIMVSENSGMERSFKNELFYQSEPMITSLRTYGSGYIMWNLALDLNDGPKTNGGASQCIPLVRVNTDTGAYSYSSDFYIMAHFSKFIRPGALQIFSTDTSMSSKDKMYNVSCLNPDGTITTVLTNKSSTAQVVKLVIGNEVIEYTMPATSLVTITWRAK